MEKEPIFFHLNEGEIEYHGSEGQLWYSYEEKVHSRVESGASGIRRYRQVPIRHEQLILQCYEGKGRGLVGLTHTGLIDFVESIDKIFALLYSYYCYATDNINYKQMADSYPQGCKERVEAYKAW